MRHLLPAAIIVLVATAAFAQPTPSSSPSTDKNPTTDTRTKADKKTETRPGTATTENKAPRTGAKAPAAATKAPGAETRTPAAAAKTPGAEPAAATPDSSTATAKRPPLGPNEVSPPMLMTPEERKTHLSKLGSFKNIEDCKTYMAEHRAKLEARAKEQHKTLAPSRVDMCERVQAAAKTGSKS